jgi:hypothetical protein
VDLAAVCQRWAQQDFYDVVSLVDELLVAALSSGRVAGRIVSKTEIELSTSSETVSQTVPSAYFMRTICARLAVVFADDEGVAQLYGGRVARRVRVGDSILDAELDFQNNLQAGAWFVVTRR